MGVNRETGFRRSDGYGMRFVRASNAVSEDGDLMMGVEFEKGGDTYMLVISREDAQTMVDCVQAALAVDYSDQ